MEQFIKIVKSLDKSKAQCSIFSTEGTRNVDGAGAQARAYNVKPPAICYRTLV